MRDMDINVHERLSSKTTQIKVKKQLVVRKDMIKMYMRDYPPKLHKLK